jgi:hypothetical protein
LPALFRSGLIEVDPLIEDAHWFNRFTKQGGPPAVSIIADISGRHDGWKETQAFVVSILKPFIGMATDDGCLRFWLASAVAADSAIDGRRFGWWRYCCGSPVAG